MRQCTGLCYLSRSKLARKDGRLEDSKSVVQTTEKVLSKSTTSKLTPKVALQQLKASESFN